MPSAKTLLLHFKGVMPGEVPVTCGRKATGRREATSNRLAPQFSYTLYMSSQIRNKWMLLKFTKDGKLLILNVDIVPPYHTSQFLFQETLDSIRKFH